MYSSGEFMDGTVYAGFGGLKSLLSVKIQAGQRLSQIVVHGGLH
jgi:hypothetical protein